MANFKQTIEKNILFYNPWFLDNSFSFEEGKLNKRSKYYELKKYFDKDLILSLVGLRRTGKTTILKQLINNLLEEGTLKKKIFFYEFDEESNDLAFVLDYYFKNILKEDLYKTKCYIFLDELQFVEGWQTVLKKYFDANPKINFIISGSTHLYLHRNTKESLAGRMIDFTILPFSWFEFLNFKYGKKYSSPLIDIFQNDFIDIVKKQTMVLLHANEFKTYLSHGEFPYFFHDVNSLELEKYYQNAILDKIFLKDIRFFAVENEKSFKDLYHVLNHESANEINLQNISREIGLSSITVKKYIEILQKMFLYQYLYKHEKSIRKQISSFKKGYVSSLNLLKITCGFDYHEIENEKWGYVIETFVYNELLKNKFENIYFYNDTKKKKEVDFVIRKGNKIMPIEVKTIDDVGKINIKNLLYFMNKNKLERGVVIYGGQEIETKNIKDFKIEFIPFYLI